MTTKSDVKVAVGVQFRSIIADCNALWEVYEKAGPGVWRAEVVNEPVEINGTMYDSDHVGTCDVFDEDQIARSLRAAAMWEGLADRRGDYFESLTVGDIVHYHNSFGQYVRCEVVRSEDGSENQLQPIALVGAWKPYDLPQRRANGEISTPYHADKVLNRTGAWQPSDGCVYESPSFVKPRGEAESIDPTALDPIPLVLPAPDAEELERIHKVWLLERIEDAIDHNTPGESLRAIRKLLEEGP
jgi:hypothetical protein